MTGHCGLADEVKRVRSSRELPTMFLKSHTQDHMACAIGALVFAGLSFGAALFPLIAA